MWSQGVTFWGSVHTYPDNFAKASVYPYKKYPRPHEEILRIYSLPQENAVIFEIRKQINKMPSSDPQRSEHMLWWVINRHYDVSVFEKLRFRPSTRQQETGVFKKIHSGERFRKESFSVTENAISVWTLTQTDKKDAFSKIFG